MNTSCFKYHPVTGLMGMWLRSCKGIWNQGKFCLWNPESRNILLMKFGFWALKSKYTSRNQEPHQFLKSICKFHWQRIQNPLPGIRNPRLSGVPLYGARSSFKWPLGIFQDGRPPIAHYQVLPTLQDGMWDNFSTLGEFLWLFFRCGHFIKEFKVTYLQFSDKNYWLFQSWKFLSTTGLYGPLLNF